MMNNRLSLKLLSLKVHNQQQKDDGPFCFERNAFRDETVRASEEAK